MQTPGIASPDMTFNLAPFLGQIAARPLPPDIDPVSAARLLNEGVGMRVYSPQAATFAMPNVSLLHKPLADLNEDDDYDVFLVVHENEDVAETAALIEARMADGDRIALVDQRYPAHGDAALIAALMANTTYIGNLAAYDLTPERALSVAMTPLRDGTAFRRYLATSLLYHWAWAALMRDEMHATFGETIPAHLLPRALTLARTRLGASLLKLGKRGLRFSLENLQFAGGRVDGLQFSLQKA